MTYLRIDEKNNIITIKFNDPINGKVTKSNSYRLQNKNKALQQANNWDFYFYEKHRYLLPKGISLSRSRNNFQLSICVNKNENKRKYIGVYYLLWEAKQAKKDIVNSLI